MTDIIIGFTGKAQSGKSTSCQMVREVLGKVTQVNFKDALVKEMKNNFKHTIDAILMDEGEAIRSVEELFRVKTPVFRALMQNYGTEVRRGDDPLYWIKLWKQTVTYTDGNIVCDDVRFINEAKAIRDMGGYVVKIERSDLTSTMSHVSETEMDKIKPDFTLIAKTGGHAELKVQIEQMIQKIKTP
jgi:hypothetical protein